MLALLLRKAEELLHLPDVSCFIKPHSWPVSQPFAGENKAVTIMMHWRFSYLKWIISWCDFLSAWHELFAVCAGQWDFLFPSSIHHTWCPYISYFPKGGYYLCVLKAQTHPVKLSFYHKESIYCLLSHAIRREAPTEACADMQLPAAWVDGAGWGSEQANPDSSWSREKIPNVSLPNFWKSMLGSRGMFPEMGVSWAIPKGKRIDCWYSFYPAASASF